MWDKNKIEMLFQKNERNWKVFLQRQPPAGFDLNKISFPSRTGGNGVFFHLPSSTSTLHTADDLYGCTALWRTHVRWADVFRYCFRNVISHIVFRMVLKRSEHKVSLYTKSKCKYGSAYSISKHNGVTTWAVEIGAYFLADTRTDARTKSD